MRKDIVYLGMIRCSDIMSLNTSDEGYNNDKKYGQKGAICGPNRDVAFCSSLMLLKLLLKSENSLLPFVRSLL
jgi:hypothetical protein